MKRTVRSLLSLVLAVATMCSAFLFSLPAAGQSDSVFGQLEAQAKPYPDWDTADYADLRFVVAIQDLHWDEVGFLLSLNEKQPLTLEEAASDPKQEHLIKISTDTVYRSIIADGQTVTAAELGGNYLAALVIEEITWQNGLANPRYWKMPIYIRAYVKRGDDVFYNCPETEPASYTVYSFITS